MTELTYDIYISVEEQAHLLGMKEGETFSKEEAMEALQELTRSASLTIELADGNLIAIPNLQEKKVYFFARPKGE